MTVPSVNVDGVIGIRLGLLLLAARWKKVHGLSILQNHTAAADLGN